MEKAATNLTPMATMKFINPGKVEILTSADIEIATADLGNFGINLQLTALKALRKGNL